MAERQRQYVYDAKVSIRSKLHILQTIRSKLNWKVDRLVSFGPQEKDHSEFRKRVFPENANLNGLKSIELVMNDVKFNQLDDEDVVRVCLLLALDYVFMGQELRHENPSGKVGKKSQIRGQLCVVWFCFSIEAFHKLTPSAIEMNELWIEVRQEVHVRTEVRRFVDKEEVRTRVVDEEDVQERAVLAKTVKEQEQMTVDLQRRLYSVEQITKQLHTGPSDVDLLDKNGNHSYNVPVGGLDHQSMEGVSQCMNNDQVDKNCNDVPDNFPVDGPEYQSVEGISQCTSVDHVDKRFNDEYDSIAVDGLISLKSEDVDHIYKVRELINDFFDTPPIGSDSVQDVGVSESMDVDQPSLDTVVKDVKTVVVPFQHQKYPYKTCVSPYVPRVKIKFKKQESGAGSYAFPKCTKKISVHEGVMSLFHDKKRMDMQWTFPWLEDGHVIRMDFWEKLVGRSHTKRGWLSDDWQFRQPNDDWVMASPYLSDMLLRVKVFEKKKINKASYAISFQYAEGVPLQGGLYGDCGLWVCIFLYRLSHNIPLEVDDSSTVSLAWCEHIIDF
ncbi:hypothetical protein Tco_0637960 [Tanacetum coccineum]